MTSRYAQLLFTEEVRRQQRQHGSRTAYARMAAGPQHADRLGARETAFVSMVDSFFIASTSSTGWPYVQHRGGPAGFLQALDDSTLGFADFRGNRQYITTGNLDVDSRVSLLLIHYSSQARFKIAGRARYVTAEQCPDIAEKLRPRDYRAIVERFALITVEAYDWNCPQHIAPRYTPEEVRSAVESLEQRIALLEQENDELRQRLVDAAPTAPGSDDEGDDRCHIAR
ncbi:pyridoxamine 5'-phosphate oxidase family protein [Streptomyces kunmingensis]|uniref:Pyridoxamine 5'-phosphate oxidase family protein n=1 Tax=Streptomyces kunmingensis TaxID=68225 RepID=A0ABU6C913_9ACTN|nr:pyridoxamine 5'-phosphate oxidase family protein [Streptomyces kunmingensis]MEB3961207.1 pyridoxamine 5'-phosphate oxidase family protein [Streptomyces kunmingensis]